jgi:hypothetical protein
VRDVLDQAVVTLHHVAYALDDVRSYFTAHGPTGFAHSEDGTRVYTALGEHGRELDALYERLSIRLGRDHPAVAQFKVADEAVLDISLTLVIERTVDPTTWLIITGWTATIHERKIIG